MGQKVNPVALRLGFIRGWESNWYSEKDFASKLMEDNQIRQYVSARLSKGGIARIVIERTLNADGQVNALVRGIGRFLRFLRKP